MEKILCASIWYKEQPTAHYLPKNINKGVVISGIRHPHCIHTFVALTGKRSVTPECGEYEQGFITSHSRFVNREEAYMIAKKANQIKDSGITRGLELYSEDLY